MNRYSQNSSPMDAIRRVDINRTMSGIGYRTLMLVVAVAIASVGAISQSPVLHAVAVDYETDGDGLIEISSLEQLDAIRYDLDGNGVPDQEGFSETFTSAFPGAQPSMGCLEGCRGYELITDLDFKHADSYSSAQVNLAWTEDGGADGWTPIGSRESPFNSTFDGNGRTVSNLYIHLDEVDAVGLFGGLGESGALGRVGILNSKVEGGGQVGVLVGWNDGAVSDSYSTGTVRGVAAVGGLVGLSIYGASVVRSYSDCDVWADTSTVGLGSAGGLVGINQQGTIDLSYATGAVSGGRHVGGLTAFSGGAVIRSYATGSVTGLEFIGGLVGSNTNDSLISASYATGTVSGGEHSGGLVGWLHYRAKVVASYATGDVSGSVGVGGLVGTAFKHGGIVASYTRGRVSGNAETGGLLGSNTTPHSISTSYWSVETSGQAVGVAVGFTSGAVHKTVGELLTAIDYTGIYEGWNVDIDNVDQDDDPATGGDDPWDFGSVSQYPALKVDLDSDGEATWEEFGEQPRHRVGSTRLTTRPPPHFVPDGNTDYDTDDDQLIEIAYLEQLDAIRYDLDGDGVTDRPTLTGLYFAAFADAEPRMGCPKPRCVGYELVADLDFNNPASYASGSDDRGWSHSENGEGWLSLGASEAFLNVSYWGDFDGNGHTISNLFINRRHIGVIGLFAITESTSAIRDLTLDEVSINGDYAVGGLIGIARAGNISGVGVTGRVSGGRNVGGLVGLNEGGTIEASWARVGISGHESTGGLVGGNGIVGVLRSSYSESTVVGGRSVGGLAGFNLGSIYQCYSISVVSGSDRVGGLAGANRSRIGSSYAFGEVSGETAVGGLVGFADKHPWSDVKWSYAVVEVTGGDEATGGLIGENQSSVILSYWDINVSGTQLGIGTGDSAGAEGKTTDELQAPTDVEPGIYSDWNWDMDNADSDGDITTGVDGPWDFGSAGQYPALLADFDGDGKATWQEFGSQRSDAAVPPSTASPAPMAAPPLTGAVTPTVSGTLMLAATGTLAVLAGSILLWASQRQSKLSSTARRLVYPPLEHRSRPQLK